MDAKKRIAIGTANFGMDYGHFGERTQLAEEATNEILCTVFERGITSIDTAQSYGSSEEVVGAYLNKTPTPVDVTTKILVDSKGQFSITRSFENIKKDPIYGILFHDFSEFRKHPAYIHQLEEYKEKGKIKKYGFSLYFTEHLEYLLENNVQFDLLQVPCSLFDQRFVKYFSILKDKGVEIHARSVFLNGLYFQDPNCLPKYFNACKEKLKWLHDQKNELSIEISTMCLIHVAMKEDIDKIVIGVRSSVELEKNIFDLERGDKLSPVIMNFEDLACEENSILVPHLWERGVEKRKFV